MTVEYLKKYEDNNINTDIHIAHQGSIPFSLFLPPLSTILHNSWSKFSCFS